MGNPKAGGGGSMLLIVVAVFAVAGAWIFFMNPVLFHSIMSTIARWLHLG